MNMKQNFSIASLLLAGIMATGCSQQQVQEAPAKPEPVAAPAPEPVAAPAPRAVVTNPDCHTHPRNSVTNSIKHCHKNPRGQHTYGNAAARNGGGGVDVRALQAKLKAKGYYKGDIDGVINEDTRDALKKFQNR